MGWVSLTAYGPGEGLTLANYGHFLANESYRQALVNSLQVTLVVTVVSVLLAYPFAWFLAEIVPERWQRLGLMLAILPFWTSYVVRSYSWLLVLGERGVLNNAMTGLGVLSEPVQLANTRLAIITGFVHFFVMLLTLTIFANLKQLSPSYRRAAADLGASPWVAFWKITVPLMKPAILVALLFRCLDAFRVFDTIFIMTRGAQDTESVSILGFNQLISRLNLGLGSAVSVLIFLCVFLIAFIFVRGFGRWSTTMLGVVILFFIFAFLTWATADGSICAPNYKDLYVAQ